MMVRVPDVCGERTPPLNLFEMRADRALKTRGSGQIHQGVIPLVFVLVTQGSNPKAMQRLRRTPKVQSSAEVVVRDVNA